jgi:hypothetical protein
LATGLMEKFGRNYSTNTAPALYKNLAIIAARTANKAATEFRGIRGLSTF